MGSEADERAAADRFGVDYDALTMAAMLADYLRGQPPALHELPQTARRLVTAYLARRDGLLGIATDQHGRLPQVPPIDRGKYRARAIEAGEVIEGEVLDADTSDG